MMPWPERCTCRFARVLGVIFRRLHRMREIDSVANRLRLTAALIATFTLIQTAPAHAHVLDEVWEIVNYEKYGFSMLLPADTHVTAFESELGDGYVTLRGNMEGAFFLGLAGANVEAATADLDALRAKLTDWPQKSWEVIDENEDKSGWTWYRTFRAAIHGDSFFGGCGVGAKGSYIFLVRTSDADFATHRADYTRWFESITLNP